MGFSSHLAFDTHVSTITTRLFILVQEVVLEHRSGKTTANNVSCAITLFRSNPLKLSTVSERLQSNRTLKTKIKFIVVRGGGIGVGTEKDKK
jgi:hypothetical protein